MIDSECRVFKSSWTLKIRHSLFIYLFIPLITGVNILVCVYFIFVGHGLLLVFEIYMSCSSEVEWKGCDLRTHKLFIWLFNRF